MSEPPSQELDHSCAVSPELALVDPELAAWARARLPDPVDALAAQAFRRLTAVPSGEPRPAATGDRSEKRGVRVLVGVAAALVVTLLLADVRVEVGKTGASAEAPLAQGESPQAAATGAQSQQGAPTRGSSSRLPSTNPSRAATEPRQLAWAPTPGAEGYHVELYRDNTRIFVAETQRPVVVLPARWTLNGTVRTLEPGDLRWYVWPLVDGRRATSAIVQATLTIPQS